MSPRPGNYPLLDLQQLHTSLIDRPRIAQRVLATVVSHYPGRGVDGTDEYMCDAGAIAMSKDSGPISGYGEVVGQPWKLGRISQEHGTLTKETSGERAALKDEGLRIGSMVQVSCLASFCAETSTAQVLSVITDRRPTCLPNFSSVSLVLHR